MLQRKLLIIWLLLIATPLQADVMRFFDLKVDGYLRTRWQGFYNGDLGNGGYSGMAPALSGLPVNQTLTDTSDSISWIDSRFTLNFSGGVDDMLSIGGRIDILDNVLWGSNAKFGGPMAPLSFFSETQDPGSGALLSVKELYAVFQPWRHLFIDAGRRSFHWGLGMVFNGGKGLDDDFGTYFDGAQIIVRFLAYEVQFAWEFNSTGAVSALQQDHMGQPYDLEQEDDVSQWRFHVKQLGKKVELGFVNIFRTQPLSSENPDWYAFGESFCKLSDSEVIGLNPACYSLSPRDFFLWTADIYGIFHFSDLLHFSFEAALNYGSIGSATESAKNTASPDIMSFGGVVKLDINTSPVKFGFEGGFALGDEDMAGFMGGGYDPEGTGAGAPTKWNESEDINHFMFHRDYRVDLILFRQLKGAIYDTVYGKVTASWEKSKGVHTYGVEFSPVFSYTLTGETFGSSITALETDLIFHYRYRKFLTFTAGVGGLFPFAGLDNPITGQAASPAWTAQSKVFISF